MGTTAEKLSYLNTTKTKIKEALNLSGANITDDTFRSYADKIKKSYLEVMNNGWKPIWNNWTKTSGTGTTLSLNNTEEAPMSLTYKGNTLQNGTPTPSSPIPVQVVSGDNSIEVCGGKNIWNNELENAEYNEIGTKIATSIWVVNKTSIRVTPNTTYTISQKEKTSQYRIVFFNGSSYLSRVNNTQETNTGYSYYTFTTPNNCTEIYIQFRGIIEKIKQGNYYILPSDLTEVQLEKGNQATTYEEYKSASYPINLGVENLTNSFGLSQSTINGVTFTPVYDEKGLLQYVNVNGTASARADYKFPNYVTYKAGNYVISKGTSDANVTQLLVTRSGVAYGVSSSASYSFTLDADYECQYWIRIFANTTITNQKVYPMAITGSTPKAYTPYGVQPIELCKIGTYQDKIDKSSGKNLCSSTDVIAQIITFNFDKDRLEKTFTISFTTNVALTGNSVYFVADGTSLGNVGTISASANTIAKQTYTMTDTMYNSIKSANEVVLRLYKSGATFIQPNDAIIVNGTSSDLEYEPYGTGWYLKKEINKVVLDGVTQDKKFIGAWTSNPNGYPVYITISGANHNNRAYSNNFTYDYNSYANMALYGMGGSSGAVSTFTFILPSTITSVAEANTWLSTHNTELYYPLATTTYETITDTTLIGQLEALKKSYEEQTNISQTNNDLPFELNVVALSNE